MSSSVVGGVALVVAGIVWWLACGALADRGQRPAPLSGRTWAGAGLYAVGVIPVMAGMTRLQEASGWSGAMVGLGAALAVVAAAFLIVLLAVRVRRRVRRGRRGDRR